MDFISNVLNSIQHFATGADAPSSQGSDLPELPWSSMFGTKDELTDESQGGFSSIFNAIKNVISSGSFGTMVNTGLDQLGLPDVIGDVVGGAVDVFSGNYVGATANLLDAAEDLAKACGGPEIAGYLKMGSQLTGMFAGGPGAMSDMVGKLSTGISLIEQGQEAVEALKEGDLASLAHCAFTMLGQTAGLDPEHAESLAQISTIGRTASAWIKESMADGEFSLDDIATMPLADLLSAMGAADPQEAGIAQALAQSIGHLHKGMPPEQALHLLIDQVIDRLEAPADEVRSDIHVIKNLKEIKDLILTIQDNPSNATAVMALLSQGAQLQQTLDMGTHHRTAIRA